MTADDVDELMAQVEAELPFLSGDGPIRLSAKARKELREDDAFDALLDDPHNEDRLREAANVGRGIQQHIEVERRSDAKAAREPHAATPAHAAYQHAISELAFQRAQKDPGVRSWREENGAGEVPVDDLGGWLERRAASEPRTRKFSFVAPADWKPSLVKPAGWKPGDLVTMEVTFVPPTEWPDPGEPGEPEPTTGGGAWLTLRYWRQPDGTLVEHGSLVIGFGGQLAVLKDLAAKLERLYGWQEAQAVAFVVCGALPLVPLVLGTRDVASGDLAPIRLQVAPGVPASYVEGRFSEGPPGSDQPSESGRQRLLRRSTWEATGFALARPGWPRRSIWRDWSRYDGPYKTSSAFWEQVKRGAARLGLDDEVEWPKGL